MFLGLSTTTYVVIAVIYGLAQLTAIAGSLSQIFMTLQKIGGMYVLQGAAGEAAQEEARKVQAEMDEAIREKARQRAKRGG